MHDILDMMPEARARRLIVFARCAATASGGERAGGGRIFEFGPIRAASTASSRGRAAATPSTRLLASDRADAAAARRA
jgi:hypothetical protein